MRAGAGLASRFGMKNLFALVAILALGVLGSVSSASATEYYCNGQYKTSGGTRYYPNGQYINSGGTRYYPNGQYINSGSSCYYENGQSMGSCPTSITTEISGVRIRVNLVGGELIDQITLSFAKDKYFGTYEMDYATAEISEVFATCINDQPSPVVADILQRYATATTQEQAQVRERVCR